MDGGAWKAAVHGVAEGRTRLSDFTFTFHFHALEKEMATHSSVLAWRIPGTGEPGGLPSMGSHRVRHNWSDLAAAAAREDIFRNHSVISSFLHCKTKSQESEKIPSFKNSNSTEKFYRNVLIWNILSHKNFYNWNRFETKRKFAGFLLGFTGIKFIYHKIYQSTQFTGPIGSTWYW